MIFRTLTEGEIEVKIKSFTEKGAIALLYKTARVDMDMLDETVGSENWEDDFREIKGNLYCGIGIRTAENPHVTIWKWDCGIESREDEEGNQKKGEASDAFKRAGFKWGIGRELYTAPFIFLPNEKINIHVNDKGKKNTYDKFEVEKIAYDERKRISGLAIKNQLGKRVYVWKAGS